MIDREKVINGVEHCFHGQECCGDIECPYYIEHLSDCCCLEECQENLKADVIKLLQEQEAVVHPEPSCEMTYITDCCCDLCGVQLIREDIFCRCCGKRIEWEGR